MKWDLIKYEPKNQQIITIRENIQYVTKKIKKKEQFYETFRIL